MAKSDTAVGRDSFPTTCVVKPRGDPACGAFLLLLLTTDTLPESIK